MKVLLNQARIIDEIESTMPRCKIPPSVASLHPQNLYT